MYRIFHALSAWLVVVATAAGFATNASADYSRLVVFGDSLSDNGNLLAATGQPPAPYFQGRFSSGPVAVERMAAQLGVPLNDFAFGGAQTGTGLTPPGILTQIASYLAARPVDPNGLYVVWGGPNDFLSGLGSPSFNASASITNAVQNVVNAAIQLSSAGVRQLFIPNMPDLGITVRANAGGFVNGANQISIAFNSALANALAQVAGGLTARITTFDTYALSRRVYFDPATYGITNTSAACFTGTSVCSNPGQYFFWDDIHPSGTVHAILGNAFAAAVVPEPSTWALMAAGLGILGVGAIRRRRAAVPA